MDIDQRTLLNVIPDTSGLDMQAFDQDAVHVLSRQMAETMDDIAKIERIRHA